MALFRSQYKGFVQNVRSSAKIYNGRGDPIGMQPALRAEFGVFGPEYSITNPLDGTTIEVADIYGGFFDSEEAKERLGWSDEDHEYVLLILRQKAKERPDYLEEIVPEHVPAVAPWVTYDESKDLTAIVEVARMTSLVPETIRYERENLNRAALLQPLLEALGELDPDAQARAESVEEIPAESLQPAASTGVRIGKGIRTTESGIAADTPGLVLNTGTIVIE